MTHILIAEDNAFFCALVSSGLEKRGYSVRTASDGRKALDILLKSVSGDGQRPFDLLITDLMMPEMDGPELIRRIRREGIGLPVIVMTAGSDREISAAFAESESENILKKPFSCDDLARRVESVLKGEV